MSEVEQETSPSPITSSKVYVRYFDYTAYYEIDRVLPSVLDSQQNGGTRTPITNDDWLAFCDNIDEGFKRLNTMQGINFYVDLLIGLATIFYLVLAFLIYVVPRPGIRFIFAVLVSVGANAVFHVYIRGPANTAAVKRAKKICEEETVRLNLRAPHGSSIDLVFYYQKRKCCSCEGYEFDQLKRQRYHDIYVEVSIRRQGTIPVFGYGDDTTTATATAVDECYNTIELANAPIATAMEISAEPSYSNGRTDAPSQPYVMASAELAQ